MFKNKRHDEILQLVNENRNISVKELCKHFSLSVVTIRTDLNELEQQLNVDFTELYAFSGPTLSETDLKLPEDGKIDLAPLVREYMLLDIPINPVCTPECKGFCSFCGERLTENPHSHDEVVIDPRLAVLKELLEEDT